MRGGIGWQVTKLFNGSGIFTPGESRHSFKEAARAAGITGKEEIARATTIYSYGTAEEYKTVWHNVAEFAQQSLGVKDIEKLNPDVIREYLLERIDNGVAHSTFAKESAAVTKLEVALNLYAEKNTTGNVYDFREVQREVNGIGNKVLQRSDGSRAYNDPKQLILSICDDKAKLAAAIQYGAGARVSEAILIKPQQLIGNNTIHLDNTKGGLARDITVPAEIYKQVAAEIKAFGQFTVPYKTYYNCLKLAAEKSAQHWQGTHGLRWNYAQEAFRQKSEDGKTYEEALQEVSTSLGHHRLDISEHYLK